MFRSYRESGLPVVVCHASVTSELGFNMCLCVFDKGRGRLLILLLASILQSTLAAPQERPLQGTGQGHFFQTSGLDNSFPSGHTIITWTAASTIAREYQRLG